MFRGLASGDHRVTGGVRYAEPQAHLCHRVVRVFIEERLVPLQVGQVDLSCVNECHTGVESGLYRFARSVIILCSSVEAADTPGAEADG